MATGFDATTTALSIYNAVSQAERDLTGAEVTMFLRRAWDARFDGEDLAEGLAYLLAHQLVKLDGERICMNRRDPSTRRGPQVQRDTSGYDLIQIERF